MESIGSGLHGKLGEGDLYAGFGGGGGEDREIFFSKSPLSLPLVIIRDVHTGPP